MTNKSFKAIRISAGITQGRMAELLGYSSYQPILRKENGTYVITKQDEIILELRFPELFTTHTSPHS